MISCGCNWHHIFAHVFLSLFFITYVKEYPYRYAVLYESSPEMTVGQVSLMAIWSFAHYGHYAHFV